MNEKWGNKLLHLKVKGVRVFLFAWVKKKILIGAHRSSTERISNEGCFQATLTTWNCIADFYNTICKVCIEMISSVQNGGWQTRRVSQPTADIWDHYSFILFESIFKCTDCMNELSKMIQSVRIWIHFEDKPCCVFEKNKWCGQNGETQALINKSNYMKHILFGKKC